MTPYAFHVFKISPADENGDPMFQGLYDMLNTKERRMDSCISLASM